MLDFIIVGQGVVGSALAWHLLRRGQKIHVIDSPANNHCSVVSAGIFTPITGKYLAKTWMAEEAFPYLLEYYSHLEQKLNTPILNRKKVYRVFQSIEESQKWEERSTTAVGTMAQYTTEFPDKEIVAPFGGIEIKNTGYISIRNLLKATAEFLQPTQSYSQERFSYDDLTLESDHVKYRHLTARKLIFCEGPQVMDNPYFNTLRFDPVRGEILEVALDQPVQAIYNGGVFLLPLTRHKVLVGATYDRSTFRLDPTEKALSTLSTGIRKLIDCEFKVMNRRVGVRPCTFDRKPYIGIHPEYPTLGICNGFGSKGVSLAPLLTKTFVEHLLEGTHLPQEVSLNRG